jgi:dephospho-CoA kinase
MKGLGTRTYNRILVLYGPEAAQNWRRKRRQSLAKKREQHQRNVAERAALYAQYAKEIPASRISDWHNRLNALSNGRK